MEAAFDLVATMSASCAQHYEDGLTPKAVTALQFSQGEIVAYCMCSTKLVAQNLEDADFRNLEENGYISALARFLDRCLQRLATEPKAIPGPGSTPAQGSAGHLRPKQGRTV